jgi:hypothetical protein
MTNNGRFIVFFKFNVIFISLTSNKCPFSLYVALYNLHFTYECHTTKLYARKPFQININNDLHNDSNVCFRN